MLQPMTAVTKHDRTEWQSTAEPVQGGTPFKPWNVEQIVIHYPGGHAPKTPADVPAYIRAVQHEYVTVRGYSIGYGELVDPWGDRWELRGYDFQCAANAVPGDGGHSNMVSYAVIVAVEGGAPANAAQVVGVRDAIRETETYCKRLLLVVGHGHLEPTACPGAGIAAQIATNVFDVHSEPTDPGEPTVTTSTARRVRISGYANVFLIGAGPVIHLTPELDASYADVPGFGTEHGAVAPAIAWHEQFVTGVLTQTGLTLADLQKGPA